MERFPGNYADLDGTLWIKRTDCNSSDFDSRIVLPHLAISKEV